MKRVIEIARSLVLYFKSVFSDGNGHASSRRIVGTILAGDFVLNVHHSVDVSARIINLIYLGKPMDAGVISALSTTLSQVVLALGIEAGLIAAFFSLTTYTSVVGKKKEPEA